MPCLSIELAGTGVTMISLAGMDVIDVIGPWAGQVLRASLLTA